MRLASTSGIGSMMLAAPLALLAVTTARLDAAPVAAPATAPAARAALGQPAAPGVMPALPAEVTAPVAFLKDLSSGAILFDRDSRRPIPPASMAKMMTVYTAFQMIARGELSLDRKLTVKPETWQRWHGDAAGSLMFLSPGAVVSVRDLLHGIVTASGNDACVVLAEGIDGTEAAFVARMNREARAIGLADSRFGTSNGWPDAGRTVVTARDLATLAERTVRDHPGLYRDFHGSPTFSWVADGRTITQPNRNPLLGKVAGADGIKTGHTEEAGYGFTGSAIRDGRRLVMVVAGIDSYAGRADQSVTLMNWGFDAFSSRGLFPAGRRFGDAPVQGGDAPTVGLVARDAVGVTTPAGATGAVSVSVVFDGPIRAPVAKGEPIGHLVVTPAGLPPQITPLVAASDVGPGSILDRIVSGAYRLFGR